MATTSESPPQKRPKIEPRSPSPSGRIFNFVSSPPGYFQTECPVCLLVLRSPYLASCCGQNFCKECIESLQKEEKPCPLCNEESFTLIYNRAHDLSLKQLEVYCTYRDSGCEWQGKLDALDDHLNIRPDPERVLEGCGFTDVQCAHDSCEQSLPRHLIVSHQSSECPHRPFSCEYCHDYESTFKDVTNDHVSTCPCYPLTCPNSCTAETFQRQILGSHLDEDCPLQEVECDFALAGCMVRLPRKDLPEHLRDPGKMVDHMSLLACENHRLSDENKQLSQQNQDLAHQLSQQKQELLDELSEVKRELTEQISQQNERIMQLQAHVPIAPVRIVFTQFNQHKVTQDLWYSRGFYTHPKGYKMCLGVYANSIAGGGTHVSCYIYMMKGEFDYFLSWPFLGNVTVELLNQLEDENHHSMTIHFNKGTSAFACQVLSGERGSSRGGYGYSTYIRHDRLCHDPVKNCQYLVNDSLQFSVRVAM